MTIKFECSYDVDINMYILCCSNRICACPSGRPCLQVTIPSGLCFVGMLINFCSSKFQALDMSFFSKGHAGFFCEFEPDMVITFDIRPEDDIEGNRDIWVNVQTPLVLHYVSSSQLYFCL